MGATLTSNTSNQVICGNCEEQIHRFASRCPYCNHDQKLVEVAAPAAPQIISQPLPSKVTHLNELDSFPKVEKEITLSTDEDSPTSLFFSLLMLLGGSFFLFFGLMMKLFSKNGRFTLEWSADSWPYFLFPALFLLFFGLMSLTTVAEENT